MPNEYVILRDNEGPPFTIRETEVITRIIRQAQQGPPGASGAGTAGAWHADTFTLVTNTTVFVLTALPRLDTLDMFVNGLLQTRNNFTVSTLTVTVIGFVPTNGDVVVFQYEE